MKPQPCGYFCTPASDDKFGCRPKNNLPPCAHQKEAHYNLDGEWVACADCEEVLESRDALPSIGDAP